MIRYVPKAVDHSKTVVTYSDFINKDRDAWRFFACLRGSVMYGIDGSQKIQKQVWKLCIYVPVVPHKAVAEVSKNRKL